MRPKRTVNVAALVASPEEVPSRPRLRMRLISVVVFALFAVLVLRLWSLQVIDRHQYAQAANSNTVRTVTVPPPRGLIVDRNDTVLVGNKVENELALTRAEVQTEPTIVGKVAALAGIAPSVVDADLADDQYSEYQPVPILKNASSATVEYLDEHQSQFPGVSVEQVTDRNYPQGGTLATPILGYTGPITATFLKAHPHDGYTQASVVGKTGVEAEAEKYLRGTPGKETLEVTPSGTVVGTKPEKKPLQGDTVVLNVTGTLQAQVTKALTADMVADRTHTTFGGHPVAPNGAAVVLNAETGAVLAMTSSPSYSLTEWVGGISTANYEALSKGCTISTGGCPLNNYAIQGLYTPGSTFKLATATAALQDGLVSPSTIIDDTGVYDVRKHGDPTCVTHCTFHDATDFDAGDITVRLALTESDDFYFYTMGLSFWLGRSRYGNTAIQKVANDYGFGEATGIDLPDEVSGRVDSQPVRQKLHQEAPTAFPTTNWYPGTNIEMAFGQGGTVLTPIEEAEAYATFDDGGVRHQPEVVGAVVRPDGKVVEQIAPKATGKVTIDPTDYQAMLQGFEGVTHSPKGTAYEIFQQDSHVPATYLIAGKTGTATTSATTHTKAPNAWFVGFGPIGQPTQYVVAVAVAQGGYGDLAAAPAVATVFNYLYAHPPATSLTLPTAVSQPSVTSPSAKAAKHRHKETSGTTTTTTAPTSTSTTHTTTTTTSPPATTTTTAPPPTTTTTSTPPTTTTTSTPGTTTTTSPPATTAAKTAANTAAKTAAHVERHRSRPRTSRSAVGESESRPP
ncbi:MAG: penicillin-binding protein 2 [Acidimicrobiales bacterium]